MSVFKDRPIKWAPSKKGNRAHAYQPWPELAMRRGGDWSLCNQAWLPLPLTAPAEDLPRCRNCEHSAALREEGGAR